MTREIGKSLSDSDARTIRRARNALGLLVAGAIAQLETNYGPEDNPDRTIPVDALLLHIRQELFGWETQHEQGAEAEEISQDTIRVD